MREERKRKKTYRKRKKRGRRNIENGKRKMEEGTLLQGREKRKDGRE